jgi:hypothetical protein
MPFISKCFHASILFFQLLFGFLNYCFNAFPLFINSSVSIIIHICQYVEPVINFSSIFLLPLWI